MEEDAPVPVTPALGRRGRFHKLNASLGCTVSSCLRTECGEASLCNASIQKIEAGGQPGLFETVSKEEKGGPGGDCSQRQRQFQQVEGSGWGVQIRGGQNPGQLGLVTS